MSSTPPNRTAPSLLSRSLRLVGLMLMLGIAGFWFAKGAHTGWSQHRVPIQQVDEVTGLEFVTYEDRYVPGIEVLATGLASGALLFGVSFFFRKKIHTAS